MSNSKINVIVDLIMFNQKIETEIVGKYKFNQMFYKSISYLY